MKKLLIAAVITVAAAYASMANESVRFIPSAGISATVSSLTADVDDAESTDTNSVNLTEDFKIIFNRCNVGIKVQADTGISWGKSDERVTTNDSSRNDITTGPKIDAYLGAGYNFINTERHILGIYGLAGCEYMEYNYKFATKIGSYSEDIDNTTTFTSFLVGGDIDYTTTFSDHFGMSIGCRVTFPVAGKIKVENKTTTNSSSVTEKADSDIKSKGYNVTPRVCLTWLF